LCSPLARSLCEASHTSKNRRKERVSVVLFAETPAVLLALLSNYIWRCNSSFPISANKDNSREIAKRPKQSADF
jgi:hypothetical protein